MNVKRADGSLKLDDWSPEQVHVTLRDAMRKGRERMQTEREEAAQLFNDKL